VIASALELLADDPAASMQEIADASGLGRTTVYRHFPTREELFTALLEHAIDESWQVARGVLEAEDGFEATIHTLACRMLETGVRFRFLLAEANPASLEVARSAADNPILAWLERMQQAGEVRQDVSLSWTVACFQGLCLLAMEDHAAGRQTLDEAGERLADSLLRLLRP
jgi:AcrR family transcriptional regulator